MQDRYTAILNAAIYLAKKKKQFDLTQGWFGFTLFEYKTRAAFVVHKDGISIISVDNMPTKIERF